MDEGNNERTWKSSIQLEKIQSTVAKQFKVFSEACAKSLMNHSVLAIALPCIISIAFGLVHVTSQPNDIKDVINVKRMFLPHDDEYASIQSFETKWFGDTWNALGSSKHSGHLVLKSKNKGDILSRESVDDVIKLHNHVTTFTALNPKDNSTTSYRSVCIKDDKRRIGNETSCQIDPLLKIMLQWHTDNSPLVFRVRTDEKTGVSSPLWTYPKGRSIKLRDHQTTNATKREVFLSRNIGLLDKDSSSARTLHLSYLLKEPQNQNDAKHISQWLGIFFKEMEKYVSDHFTVLVETSESINNNWVDLVQLKAPHVVYFCVVNFFLVSIYSATLGDFICGAYLGVCSVCSLFMTIVCTVSIHNLIYGNPHFNFVQCVLLIAVSHALFHARFVKYFIESLAKLKTQQECDEITERKIFTDVYHLTLSWNFVFLVVFLVSFSASCIPPDVLSSIHHMSVTLCIGFVISFSYHATFFPTCARVYQTMIRKGVESIRARRISNMKYGMIEFPSDASSHGQHSIRPHGRAKITRERTSKTKKCKKLFRSWLESYFNGVVSTYMRPFTVLFYLTYLSFCYVGCIHFSEGISPFKLLPMKSIDLKCLQKVDEDFEPFTPRFVVMGRVDGDPWDEDVSDLLHQIHNQIVETDVIDEASSDNWFLDLLSFSEKIREEENQAYGSHQSRMRGPELFIDPSSYAVPGLNEPDVPIIIDDWPSLWANYTMSERYRERLGVDILFPRSNSTKKSFIFRWIYQTRNLKFHETKQEFIENLKNIKENVNLDKFSQIYFYAPEFRWSSHLTNFTKPTESVFALVLVAICMCMVLLKLYISIIWLIFTSLSICFGLCGLLSFYSIELDSFIFPCILFVLPFSTVLTSSLFKTFSEGKDVGRSKCARINLKETSSHGVFCLATLLVYSIILAFDPSYSFHNPLFALLLLILISSLHLFFFIPVLLTIFPPSKKISNSLPQKSKNAKTGKSKKEAFQQRPHLHARRFFYDSQRAASFRSDEEDGRIEHITCL
ncbi:patched domain-containing protein 1-like isoform X2 [Ciona intestinalis]